MRRNHGIEIATLVASRAARTPEEELVLVKRRGITFIWTLQRAMRNINSPSFWRPCRFQRFALQIALPVPRFWFLIILSSLLVLY